MNSSVSDILLRAAGGAPARHAPPWPQLRQELALHPGPSLRNGQPSWTLHDPVRNLYFQLDWLSFEVLANWDLADVAAIAQAISEATTLRPTVKQVEGVVRFFGQNQLAAVPGADNSRELAAMLARGRHRWWQVLLHHYLFFRVPLLKPDALLGWLMPRLAFLFSRGFLNLSLLAGLTGVMLVYRQWSEFSSTLVDNLSWSGAAAWGMVLVLVKVLHEFGHGLMAKRYGCRVPTMGLAFLVLFPMPYTDVNEAWKLRSRRQRLLIGSAGVLTELVIAAWATLFWVFLPDGVLRHMAFLLSTTTWISTLVVNCSPFMRFDGYFLLSDFLELPNLHARSFALARWKLRELLFDFKDPPPEHFSPGMRRALLFFAWFTWIYRLVVFLGIAALVYGFFIKAVGILLFAVEIIWFVIMPVMSEIKVWSARRAQVFSSRRARIGAVLLLVAAGLIVLPLPGLVRTAGLLHTGQELPVHAREAARLAALHVKDGARVTSGTPLLSMDAEAVQQKLAAVEGRRQRFEAEVAVATFNVERRVQLQVRESELLTAERTRSALESQKQEFEPVARVDGTFRLLDPDLRPGTWVSRNEQVATVVTDGAWTVECYVDEESVHRLTVGDTARFYPDGRSGAVLELRVAGIDRDAAHVLDQPVLASLHGGSIEVRETEGRLIPEKAAYRVTLEAVSPNEEFKGHTWRGKVVMRAAPESLAARFARAALSLLWREAGL
ncbi:site-2 protease family protein [Noviherbaspirillum aridicola]|uniref:Peptidase M50 n=1 Tax=Noviherbaspirillum aridicola TaxID=2849687 RepID=A0ABQ4Q1R2_9BURK|nr:site-2 protease family protein [Noviherbaspirillum aridicola]GIZ51128.1 peptidase M50 [Noviherbaspirillum aridicola]